MQAAQSDPDHVDLEGRERNVDLEGRERNVDLEGRERNVDPKGPKATDPPATPAAPAAPAGSVDDRISNRVPLERRVEMRFEDFDGFMTECSMNISATGMFIGCREPQPAGSVLDFKFALDDGDQLIRGYGEVMWARRRDDGPERPAGMGVRFLHLDAESRELIRWTVTRRYITGGGPCDVDEVKSAMRRAAEREAVDRAERSARSPTGPADGVESLRPARNTSPRPLYREAGYAAVASKPSAARKWRPVAALAALMLGGLYLLQATSASVRASSPAIDVTAVEGLATEQVAVVAQVQPAITQPSLAAGAKPAAPEVVAGDGAENPPQPAFSKGGSEVGARPASPAARPASPEIAAEEAVKDWARAWSQQRPDDYLAAYAADFRPPRGLSRDGWEEQRRVRIRRPRWIQLELGAIVAEAENAGRARVTFDQSYRSDTYHDVVRKTLVMVREDAGWKILEERTDG